MLVWLQEDRNRR
jgi:hypothetical protein